MNELRSLSAEIKLNSIDYLASITVENALNASTLSKDGADETATTGQRLVLELDELNTANRWRGVFESDCKHPGSSLHLFELYFLTLVSISRYRGLDQTDWKLQGFPHLRQHASDSSQTSRTTWTVSQGANLDKTDQWASFFQL